MPRRASSADASQTKRAPERIRKNSPRQSAPFVSGTRWDLGEEGPKPQRIFLLSPANLAGVRGKWLINGQSKWSLRLRGPGIPVGELFAFVSGLYFRGKLTYAQAFAGGVPQSGETNTRSGKTSTRSGKRSPAVYVITSCFGLLPLDEVITVDHVRAISAVPIDHAEPRYRVPLERDARLLARRIGKRGEVVLLGSIATPKYVEPLSAVFGSRLLFPVEFAGRGDMSRGGLMLRCARAGCELEYRALAALPESARHGPRPPRLAPVIPRHAFGGK